MAKGHATAVMIITPEGIPLVRDPKKQPPLFWKVPGGRGDATETARQCACREIREELGVTLLESDLRIAYEEDKGSHVLTLFVAKLPALPKLKEIGDEGEEIKVFPPQQLLRMADFFPNHRRVFEKYLRNL